MAKDEQYKTKKVEHHKVDSKFVDDGAKYDIVSAQTGKSAYFGNGAVLSEAARIARSLANPSGIARIEADGSRTTGSFDGQQFIEAAA